MLVRVPRCPPNPGFTVFGHYLEKVGVITEQIFKCSSLIDNCIKNANHVNLIRGLEN